MKINPLLATLAAAVLLTVAVSQTQAGTLTIDNGPSFLPGSSFTDNTIDAILLHNPGGLNGDVVRLFGDSMVAPASEAPRIVIGGSFSANSMDLFSVIYDFTVNLNSATPITLTVGAQTIVAGVQQTFNTLLVINPGIGHYQGQINGPLFSLATSGTWSGRLFFNLTTPAEGGSPDNPAPGNLIVRLRAVDFQLVSVPEPSSIVSLALGLALVGGFALRRRLAA